MTRRPSGWLAAVLCCTAGWASAALAQDGAAGPDPSGPASGTTPNVVVILADDLGWGDVGAMNPVSAMSTPRIDSLADEGMRFTDAHSPSSVCTPTRYGLLTGRYAWRTRLQQGVFRSWVPALIEPDRPTLGTLLQAHGYRTAAIGKWHLGWDFPTLPGVETAQHNDDVDFAGAIANGPVDRGFDEFFGLVGHLKQQPEIYIRDDRFTAAPPHFFDREQVLDRLTEEAVAFIDRSSQEEAPFFLYFALMAPHVPLIPAERFRGTTGLGPYGDFVAQVDWTVGQVLDALDRAGVADDTLLLFTSDNGSRMERFPDGAQDHVHHASISGYGGNRHRANGDWRGMKGEIHEGGHRVPFLVRWPGVVEAGSATAATVSQTDLYATLADVVGEAPDARVAPDSVSLLPMLRGEPAVRGVPVVHHSARGMFAVRYGRWKLVLGDGAGGWYGRVYQGVPWGLPWQLFDMADDPGEIVNLVDDHGDVVLALDRALETIRAGGTVEVADEAYPPDADGEANHAATGRPVIRGRLRVGGRLTASLSAVGDADGLPDADGFAYQWIRVTGGRDIEIPGATGATYRPAAADAVSRLKVRVRFTDGAGNRETLISGATRVVPLPAAPETVRVDYDVDDDGLIEMVILAQLDAVRHDLDGDGVPTASGAAAHAAAFPDAAERMGCPAAGCLGYELAADLDFDTDGSGAADAGDAFWNGGAGWRPLGTFDEPFAAVFSGNGRTVSHLFVGGGDNAGLFGLSSGVIRGVGVVAADVTGSRCAGALAGLNGGRVEASWSTGAVTGDSCVGGLVGVNGLWVPAGGTFRPLEGFVTASWSAADATAEQWAGGLVGYDNGTVVASYATGVVTATTEGSGAGGLVGRMGFGDNRITASYATGAVSGPGGAVGGLVGHAMPHDRVEASYWDTEASGVTESGGGAGRTTMALQEPTGYTGPYAAWNVDVDGDGDGLPDAPWDFGTSGEYPVLAVDADGDGVATWRELGLQGRTFPRSASGAGAAATARSRAPAAFTDDPLVPGVTPVRAAHLLELRARIDGLRLRAALPAFGWTDAQVVPGATPARAAHLLELRSALGEAYASAARAAPGYTDAAVTPGATAMRAMQLQELRRAVVALEAAPAPTGP